MSFEEVLDQAMAMLQRRRRLTYRLLKRHFALDDEELEDLAFELIYGQKLAVDEDGQVLVWTGEGVAAPGLIATGSEPATQAGPVTEINPLPPNRPITSEGERRQLTVMFVDLVESTSLAERLDPEELREVVRAYQRVCADAVTRFDGHIAKYMGDGLMAYFGYPIAHEDDAIRATYVGLAIVDGVSQLNVDLEQEKAITLRVRVGIHTGLVVAGEMGGEQTPEEYAVVGETPNIASRVEGVADPNSVVITSDTHNLIEGNFVCQPLGSRILKGVSQPVEMYRVMEEASQDSRFDLGNARFLQPIVGREQEVGLLAERWNRVKESLGQVVILEGEAGIGKSRLVEALKEHVGDEAHTRLECRGSPYYENTVLYPIVDLLQRRLGYQPADAPNAKLEKLVQELRRYRLPLWEAVPIFAPLLSLPAPEDSYPPLNLSADRRRQKTLESILAILLELTEQQPLLFILEDLQWVDPTTLELLDLLIDQTPTASIYVLLTSRPEFQLPWSRRSYLTEVKVRRLSMDQIGLVVDRVAGNKSLPGEVKRQIVDKTDGVPLFVEEVTKAVLESGILEEADGRYELVGPLSSLAIPSTLQDSLMARLDRLVTAKGVAQYAAVIGRQFSFELLSAVSHLDGPTLERELGRLIQAELLYQRGLPPHSTYVFRHSLIQEAAYESLLKSTRRQYHQRIAQVLEEQFSETAKIQPELLAHHYTEAESHQQAALYWQRAGERAREGSAHTEAIGHLTTGLEILDELPRTQERDEQKLVMLLSLGNSLAVTRGWAAPEVEKVYTQALELCELAGDNSQLLPVLWGLSQINILRADVQGHRDIGERLFSLDRSRQDPMCLMAASWVTGVNSFHAGDFAESLEHITQAFSLHDDVPLDAQVSLFGIDLGVFALSYLSHTLWCLGYPEQARQKSRDAVSLAQKLSHPFSLTVSRAYSAMLSQFCRDIQSTLEQAEATVSVCEGHNFAYYFAWGTIIKSWVKVESEEIAQGIDEMQEALADLRATGSSLRLPYYRALLALAFAKDGQVSTGLRSLDQALTEVQETGESWIEAELHRIRGEILIQWQSDNTSEAETCFRKALDIARQQHAKSWELRAATSLARLLQAQGKRQEACSQLGQVYGWFTEGFDTEDLQETKSLLKELS